MLSPHITSATMEEFHQLSDQWTLWAHLPHDTDWSISSYKKIYTVQYVEELIALIETLPDIFRTTGNVQMDVALATAIEASEKEKADAIS